MDSLLGLAAQLMSCMRARPLLPDCRGATIRLPRRRQAFGTLGGIVVALPAPPRLLAIIIMMAL